MGRLTTTSGRTVWLTSEHTIGRHRDSELVLADDDVSRHHAVIRWQSGCWVIKDLGSRNGSFVAGQRLSPGGERALRPGDVIHVASAERLMVDSAAPPEPLARAVGAPEIQVGIGGILGFPDPDEPLAQIVRSGGGWLIEGEGEPRRVRDGDVVEVGGKAWRLSLPDAEEGTVGVTLPEIPTLRFEVSQDEEHVQLEVVEGEVSISLGSRAHHYTLLVLARQRVRDAASGIDAAEQGWLAQADLERMLRLGRNAVYQHLYRARRELAPHLSGTDIEAIERRHDAGQLRIGLDRVEVTSIAG